MKYLKDDHDPDKFARQSLVWGLVYVVVVLATLLAISLAFHVR